MQIDEIINECTDLKRILEHKSEEIKQQELLKDIDAKRTDWERRSALFLPSKQRLERGGKTLELGEIYEAIKEQRILRNKNKIRQSALRDEMANTRNDLHNAEEAFTLIESEYRDKLAEQTNLNNIAQKVKALDKQIKERQDGVVLIHIESEKAEKQFRECSEKVEKEQSALAKIEISLRETRKFLQLHSVDEKLKTGLVGIQKCFALYERAEEKRTALKASWADSIETRQHAQNILNDRSALFSDVNHRYAVLEKNFTRARAFYESTLKGKSISEWREICDKNTKKLTELDELYSKLAEAKSLEERLKNFQDMKLRIQQETRSLNIKDVEQSGKIHELQELAEKLEKRVELLNRIKDIEAVRELLQDNIPCPLCGSITHPYASGATVPDPEEVKKQLSDTQKELDELKNGILNRQTKAEELNNEISSIERDEADLRSKINEINSEISLKVSLLGLKFSPGISPFEELDRERQKTRDALQLARNAAETAEAAERDVKTAGDEFEKIREKRSEAARFNQEALFALQNEKSREVQTENECKTQDEVVNSLKRELISQITPYGYKSLPDKNPGEVINELERRMTEWQKNSKLNDEFEHELSAANSKMATLKKNRETLKLRRDDFISRVKAAEAERDNLKQQRVILFASKNPDDEMARINKNVEELRAKLNERREIKNDIAKKFDDINTDIHTLETEMAKGREELQKREIAFNKRMLALGFKNEEDYATACLTPEERRDLQNKLRELTQTDLDLKSERENTRAKILELQSDGKILSNDEITEKLKALKKSLSAFRSENNDAEILKIYNKKIEGELIPVIKKFALICGLPEVF